MSGEQSQGPPARTLALVDEAVVQAERPVLPELDTLGQHAVARPVWRARHRIVAEPLRHLGDALLQELAIVDRPRLVGRPSADLAEPRAGREIGVGFGVADALDSPLDAHLTAQRLPV